LISTFEADRVRLNEIYHIVYRYTIFENCQGQARLQFRGAHQRLFFAVLHKIIAASLQNEQTTVHDDAFDCKSLNRKVLCNKYTWFRQ
jgi:hypothetical protein